MGNEQEESKVNAKSEDAKTDEPVSEATKEPTKKSTEESAEESTEESAEESTEESVQKTCSDEPVDDAVLQKIKEQIEFYFGDVNLSRDKFLQAQMKLDDNWIRMTVMLRFKRLAALSKSADVILKAIESSEMIEVSPDKKKIRRAGTIPKFTEEWKQEQKARTVYMKGFPLNDMTIEKFKEFLKPYESHENIVMRKYSDKRKNLHFKGSIFVQFKTLENAKAFMEREPMKYGDTELIRKWAVDYAKEKLAEKENWKKKKLDNKNKTEKGGDRNDGATNNDEKVENEDNGPRKGSVFHFKDVPQGCTREKIKDWLTEAGANVAYIDFKKGEQEGYVRLRDENSAKPFLEKTKEKTLVVDDVTLPVRVIEGTEEEEYLAKVKEDMKTAKDRYLSKGKHQSKKGRNAQRNAKKRRSSPDVDEPATKKTAVN